MILEGRISVDVVDVACENEKSVKRRSAKTRLITRLREHIIGDGFVSSGGISKIRGRFFVFPKMTRVTKEKCARVSPKRLPSPGRHHTSSAASSWRNVWHQSSSGGRQRQRTGRWDGKEHSLGVDLKCPAR